MRKLQRWVMLHRITAFLILTVIYALGISAINDMLPNYSWIIGTVLAILYFLSLLTIATAPDAWLQEPLKALHEQCDPFPLLQEMHGLPMEKLSKLLRQTMIINYCVGLHYIGNHQLDYDTLSSINIDKHAGMLPVNKAIYYNNLSSVCHELQKQVEAEMWYTKMMQIYNDLPDNKLKRNLETAVQSAQANHYYYTGEHEKAMELLSTVKPKNLLGEVDLHMQLAQNYLALGEKDLARENLQLVIEKGNKLYAVTEAKELLAKLDAE